MIYKEPRPYWIEQGLLKGEMICARDYGNPCGFALIAMGLAVTVELDLIKHFITKLPEEKGKTETDNCCWTGLKLFLGLMGALIPWALAYLVGYARFEGRANAWNQILYGMLIGFWSGIVGFYIMYDPLRVHTRSINRAE